MISRPVVHAYLCLDLHHTSDGLRRYLTPCLWCSFVAEHPDGFEGSWEDTEPDGPIMNYKTILSMLSAAHWV